MLTCYLGKWILYCPASFGFLCSLSPLSMRKLWCVFSEVENRHKGSQERTDILLLALPCVCSSWEKETRLGLFAQVGFQETSSCNSRVFILYWGGWGFRKSQRVGIKGVQEMKNKGLLRPPALMWVSADRIPHANGHNMTITDTHTIPWVSPHCVSTQHMLFCSFQDI